MMTSMVSRYTQLSMADVMGLGEWTLPHLALRGQPSVWSYGISVYLILIVDSETTDGSFATV